MTRNPPGQYADDRNLHARQRFWQRQDPYFDDVGWVLDLAGLSPGMRMLDAGCGNGLYLRGPRDRRVVAAGGACIAVTNGARHTRSLRDLVERAVRGETPGWRMRPATHAFTAENAAAQLAVAFETVTCVRPARTSPVVIRRQVQAVIDDEGAFIASGDLAAFICR